MRYERPKNPLHPNAPAQPPATSVVAAVATNTGRRRWFGSDWAAFAFRAALVFWVVVMGLIVRRRIFISHDTISNYAHVWYVADRFRATGTIPFHMPALGHGKA